MANAVAVIVGATGAVGGAITSEVTAQGVPVLGVGRGEEALNALARANPLVTPCVADIASDDAIATIAGALSDGPWSGVRLALTAAGLPVRGSAETIETDGLGRAIDIKLGGMLRLLRATGEHLSEGSRIVAISGFLAAQPNAGEAAPGVVNAALQNLMRQLSLIWGPRGVSTHTISPGPMDSDRLRRIATVRSQERGITLEAQLQEYADESSLGRLGSIDEVAWVAGLLLDPRGAALHGSTISLDGGRLGGIF